MKEKNEYNLIRNFLWAMFIMILFLTYNVQAQEYNFAFYNGDVIQNPAGNVEQQSKKGETSETVAVKVEPTQINTQVMEKPEDKNEKLRRTGIGFIGGYSENSFRDMGPFMSGFKNQTLRAGLAFISSYDFNLEAEFLSNSVSGDLQTNFTKEHASGRIPGISIGIRNNYWLAENVGISLGGNIRGIKGTLSSSGNDYLYKSYGAGLSVGPTFEIGKIQIVLAYEYAVDNIAISSGNNNAFKESKWTQNSALKGVLNYRF